jgi:hypothetical protein
MISPPRFRGKLKTVIAAAILRHLHAVISTGRTWDPAIATHGSRPLSRAAGTNPIQLCRDRRQARHPTRSLTQTTHADVSASRAVARAVALSGLRVGLQAGRLTNGRVVA